MRIRQQPDVILARLVDEARLLSEDPEDDLTLDLQTGRRVQIDTRSMAVHGIAYLDSTLDTSDALDLEKARQLAAADLKAVHVHYTPDSDLGRRGRVRVENTRGVTTLDQISEWLDHRPGATVKVTPVIDLPENAEIEPGRTKGEHLPCRHGPASADDSEERTHRMLEPGYYVCHSPDGQAYLRTPVGTISLT